MSILTAASYKNVLKGFDYYKSDLVLSCEKIDDDIYSGKVKGSNNNIYNVVLNVNHPRSSTCDCPYAEGSSIICKHKIALYFYIFPDEATEYEEWLYSNAENVFDEDEYEDYDDYDDYDEYEYQSTRNDELIPYCYDKLLENHINNMNIEQLKEIVKEKFNEDKINTFKNILKDEYENYILINEDNEKIEKLRNKLKKYLKVYDYNYADFNIKILTSQEKTFIKNNYYKYKKMFDETLLVSTLAEYEGYIWIVNFYKDKLSDKEKTKFTEELQNTLNSLKHYSIKNKDCKANILIAMYLLNEYSVNHLAKSIVKNYKYDKYANYVINNYRNIDELYLKTKDVLDVGYCFEKREISSLILTFYSRYEDNPAKGKEIVYDQSYYDFIFNNNKYALKYLILENNLTLLEKVKSNIKNNEQLLVYYECYEEYEKMYEILKKENKPYLYSKYLDSLKDIYGKEFLNYYKKRMYEILDSDIGREIYKKALLNVAEIKRLNNGDDLVRSIYNELSQSKHSKKYALFDEFKKYL